MYVIFLLLIVLILLLVQLNLVDNDIFHPSVIVYACYALALIFAVIEMDNWDIYISDKTFFIILTGLVIYMVISMMFRKTLFIIGKRNQETCTHSADETDIVDIQPLIMVFIDVFSLLIALRYFLDIRRSTGSLSGITSISTMIYQYRVGSVNGTLESGLSSFSAHGFQILFALTFICIYLIAINAVEKTQKTIFWYLMRLIPIVCFLFCSLISGSRNPLLQVVLGSAVTVYIFMRAKNKFERKFKLKSAFKFIVIGIIVLVIFVQLKDLLGRTTQYNFLEYIAEYIAAPIKNFDVFISKDLRNDSALWGRETFVSIWKFIGSLTGKTELINLPMNKEFNFLNGMSLGNVYTSFREYYYDFGLAGIIILTTIHSFIFTSLYARLRKTSLNVFKTAINKKLLIYAFITQALFYFCVDDRLFQAYLSQGNFEAIIFMLLFAVWLPRFKL